MFLFPAQAKLDKNNMETLLRRAVQATAKFNAELNKERKEERRAYFDLQTNVSACVGPGVRAGVCAREECVQGVGGEEGLL